MYQYKNAQQKTNITILHAKASNPHPQAVHTYKDIRIQHSDCLSLKKINCSSPIIQKTDWRTNSLIDEREAAVMPEELKEHNKIHHTLPRKKIRELSDMLEVRNLIQILEIFGRESDGVRQNEHNMSLSSRKGPISFSKANPLLDENARKVLKDKVLITLQSLRSNLTLGPDLRSNDPGEQLDPNREASGDMDELSKIYDAIFTKISACSSLIKEKNDKLTKMKPLPYSEIEPIASAYNERIREQIDSIIALLQQAERILAESQHTTIKETQLRPYDKENWIPYTVGRGQRAVIRYRKRGHTADGRPKPE